jgi:flavin reductase (DIM6/NTAB) family NADH-FMN oxidoreductase RutF
MNVARSAAPVPLPDRRSQQPVDPAVFRAALASHPAGVVVITAHDEQGPMGLTATSFVSISLDPPLVGFAVDKRSTTWARLRNARSMVVHLLGEEQDTLASTFATKGIDRFGGPTSWASLTTGEPLLTDVTTWLRCATHARVTLGDHHLVVGEVVDARVDSAVDGTGGCTRAPLLYHQRGYRSVRAHLS